MMTIEEVVEEINGIDFESVDDLQENIVQEIIIAFGDYEYEEESEVLVTEDPYGGYTWQAYVNHEDSPIILIKANGLQLEAVLK